MKFPLAKLAVILSFSLSFSPLFAADAELEAARKNISKELIGVNPENILPSPIKGLYQVHMPPRFFYASADGRYVVDGDLIDTRTRQNVSETARNKSVAAAVEAMGEESMIIFGNKKSKHTVTVFTDIDCGYCRKLHKEIKKYNQAGIRIRYLAYPRAGIGSGSFNKIEAVWCSKDRAKAMTDAKNGINVKSEKCDSPVVKHYTLGQLIGLRGTPALVLEDGMVVPGYVPAARLSEALNEAVSTKAAKK